jgi:hypothetical protein
VEYAYVTFNEADLDQIQSRLGAALDIYRGRSATESVVDTMQLTRSPGCVDLAAEEVFRDYVRDYEMASADFVFSYPGFGDVRVRVSTIHGSVWIRTSVTEDVIDHVFDVIRQVKGLP